jgi:hypothetical protein
MPVVVCVFCLSEKRIVIYCVACVCWLVGLLIWFVFVACLFVCGGWVIAFASVAVWWGQCYCLMLVLHGSVWDCALFLIRLNLNKVAGGCLGKFG